MTSSLKPQFWVNGQKAAYISVQDRAFAYGDGLFATMCVGDGGEVQFLQCHCDKLTQGAQRLGFDWQISTETQVQIEKLAKSNPKHAIKLQISRGIGGRGYAPSVEPNVTEVLSVHPIPAHYRTWQQQGIALQRSDVLLGRQPRLAGIKHTNRLEQVLIKSQTLQAGFDDFWISDDRGNVIEASMANLFVLIDEQWHTPSMAHAGVAGMMRRQVIQALLEMGCNVSVNPISAANFKKARAVLMTNSLAGVIAVHRIDNVSLTDKEVQYSLDIAQQLRDKLLFV